VDQSTSSTSATRFESRCVVTIELISIGTELLSGYTVNTNAAFIGRKLLQAGFSVVKQTVVADEYDTLNHTFKAALHRAQIVIVTGGLGPTLDDITKNVAVDLFQSTVKFDEAIAEDLKNRYGPDMATLINQATVPENAIIIKNLVGTAPGFIFNHLSSILILLPGVPKEMESMMIHDVVPYLKNHYLKEKQIFDKSLQLFAINESAVDPALRSLKNQFPLIDFGIYPAEGKVTVVMSSHQLGEEKANETLEICFNILSKQFQSHLFLKSKKIEEVIFEEFKNRKLFLSLAESCTGGKISAKLVAVPGASDYFLGGIVCYSDFLKTKLLSVSEKLIDEDGAVSENCVREMASSILNITGSDYSIAVSGVAGPSGGSVDKPVGTVFGAIGYKGGGAGKCEYNIKVFKMFFRGNREQIIESTTNVMLFELYKAVTSK